MKRMVLCFIILSVFLSLAFLFSAAPQASDLPSSGITTSLSSSRQITSSIRGNELTIGDPKDHPILLLDEVQLVLDQVFPYEYQEPFRLVIQSVGELNAYVEMLLAEVENHYVGWGFTMFNTETGKEVDMKPEALRRIREDYSGYDESYFDGHVLYVYGVSYGGGHADLRLESYEVANRVLSIRLQKIYGFQIFVMPEHILQGVYVMEIDKDLIQSVLAIDLTVEIVYDEAYCDIN